MVKMVEKVLACNPAKKHQKGKGGPGVVKKYVEKDHSGGNSTQLGLLGCNRSSSQQAVKDQGCCGGHSKGTGKAR